MNGSQSHLSIYELNTHLIIHELVSAWTAVYFDAPFLESFNRPLQRASFLSILEHTVITVMSANRCDPSYNSCSLICLQVVYELTERGKKTEDFFLITLVITPALSFDRSFILANRRCSFINTLIFRQYVSLINNLLLTIFIVDSCKYIVTFKWN